MQQRDVAIAIGISVGYMNDIEHGRKVPPVYTAHKVADFYGVPVTDLWICEDRPVLVKP